MTKSMTTRRFAAIASLLISAGLAHAQIVITTNTTIAPGDPTYQNQDIVVRGCAVIINGAQSFSSLTIERNEANVPGLVTHSATFTDSSVNGMFINITGDLIIQGAGKGGLVASSIDVTALGFQQGQGPGASPNIGLDQDNFTAGGTYGGEGGTGKKGGSGSNFSWYTLYVPAACYGSITAPTDHGSGTGNKQTLGSPIGYAGGGCVRLNVGGTATIDGSILANGQGGLSGGSGGAIFITTNELAGAGTIDALGGAGAGGFLSGGGGGGGRISLGYDESSFTGSVSAAGGPAAGTTAPTSAGGSGTVYLHESGQQPQLIIDNALAGAGPLFGATQLSGTVLTDADVIVRNNARVAPRRQSTAQLHWTISGSLTVDATSMIGASARGPYPAPAGNGFPGFFPSSPGGGGHGGAGANGANPGGSLGFGGPAHGNANAPTSFGGAGGQDELFPGRRGGGAFRLTVSGPITLNGAITADASWRIPEDQFPGAAGGAGGSVWVEAASISGSGSIRARGGSGGAAGGGGRVRIDTCDALAFPLSSISVVGGGVGAGDGSIVTDQIGAAFASQSFSIDPFVPHETVVLTASATGDNLSYQWRRNGVDLPEGFGGGRYTGTQTATLTVADPTCAEDTASIDFVVSNLCDVSSSNAAQLRSAIDWNGDGTINSTDVSDFINAWFTDQAKGSTVTDINGDGVSNSTDVSDFINFWFEEEPAC